MEFKSVENIGRDFRDTLLRLLRDYSEALLLAVLMAVILRTFVFASYKISNLNMEPGLKLGDFIVGYRLPYGFNVPFTSIHVGRAQLKRGEVVIFKCPMQPDVNCIKRVVGLPGDRIEMKGQRLYVNGKVARYLRASNKGPMSIADGVQVVELIEQTRGMQWPIWISDTENVPNFGPYVVAPDSFFTLGDNRDFSEDSRHWGAIAISSVESRALFVWLSIEWFELPSGRYGSQLRWERIFSAVH